MIRTDATVPGFNSLIVRIWQGLGSPMEGGVRIARVTGVVTAAFHRLVSKYFHNLTTGLQRWFTK